MSDITFMRGYGFPRGGRMDYAGYAGGGRRGGFGGLLMNNRPRQMNALQAIPFVPEPSIFEKIPALDGFGEGGSFGTEYNLPVLDTSSGEYASEDGETIYGPEYRPELLRTGGGSKVVGVLAVAAGLWFLFGR